MNLDSQYQYLDFAKRNQYDFDLILMIYMKMPSTWLFICLLHQTLDKLVKPLFF